MEAAQLDGGEGGLATLLRGEAAVGQTSSRLLERFAASRDEAAFAALVARHGPMVRATCRRLLVDPADADDAFQATFLVLARRAGAIRAGDRLAPWLHGVARRVAARRQRGNARRRQREVSNREPGDGTSLVTEPANEGFELRSVLDEELARLPSKYREPLILCYLDGLTSDEAADRLAWPPGTVRTRLAGGRNRLRSRLQRRGYAPGAALALSPATLPTAVVSPTLQATTVRLALGGLARSASGAPVAALLARGVLTSMLTTKLIATTVGLAATATLAIGIGRTGAQIPAPTDGPSRANLPPGTIVTTPQPTPATAPQQAPPSVVRNDPPLAAHQADQAGMAAIHPSGPPVTAEQLLATYFNAWTFNLADGWQLDSPLERDRAILFKPGGGQADTFASPGQITTVVPVVNGDQVGLHLVGPKISEVAAYSPAEHRWSRQALREAPADGKVMPLMGGGMVEYTVGRFLYAYSTQANRWGVLELQAVPAGIVPPDSIIGPPGLTVVEGNTRHIFDVATGEWSHRTRDGQTVPPPASTPVVAQAATAPKPAPAPAPAPDPTPAAPTPPRHASLQEILGRYLMVTSAEMDRVTMIDPRSDRKAVLKLGRPATQIVPLTLSFARPDDQAKTNPDLPVFRTNAARQRGQRSQVALALRGPALRKVALFDPEAFVWSEQLLAEPATGITPLYPADPEGNWVTFDLVGPRVTESPAFHLASKTWVVDKLDNPPQGWSEATVTAQGVKITRSGPFYHFRRLDEGPTVAFQVQTGGGRADHEHQPYRLSVPEMGITVANGAYCVQDGDTLNIVTSKPINLRRINLAEEGNGK